MNLLTFIIFGAAFVLIIFLIDFLLTGRKRKLLSNMKGPRHIPILGSFLPFLKPKTTVELKQFGIECFQRYGKTYQVWLLNRLTIITCDINLIETILNSNKHIKKHIMYNILHDWLGTGLLLSYGPKWFKRRKALTPSFHFQILEKFIPIFDEQSKILVENLKQFTDGKNEFDIEPFITLATLDVMAECAMGTKICAQQNPNCEYVVALKELTRILCYRFVKIFYRNRFIFSVFRPNEKKREDQALKIVHEYTENIIIARRNALQQNLNKDNVNAKEGIVDDIGIKEKSTFLDVLLKSTIDGKPLTNEDIREEVDTFLFEGHDTTSSGICFALYLISRHPNVQKKIVNEISQVIGDDREVPINYRILTELKYLECVIKETLRLYPPVPFLGRETEEDIVLNDQSIISKGAYISIVVDEMMRDPDLFENPENFIPERHLISDNDETKNGNSFAFVPFSAGPRNCIGQKFAMLEMKSTISKILRYYELLPMGQEIQPEIQVILKSTTGFQLGIKTRNYMSF